MSLVRVGRVGRTIAWGTGRATCRIINWRFLIRLKHAHTKSRTGGPMVRPYALMSLQVEARSLTTFGTSAEAKQSPRSTF